MNDLLRQLIRNVVDSTDHCNDGRTRVKRADLDRLDDYLAVNPPGPREPIVVILSCGQVEDIQIPYEGYSVEVRDYDVVDDWRMNADPSESGPLDDWTEVDENGARYATKTWSL